MSKIQAPNLVTLEYQISQLSSSQHRAGLAGLILKIQWLQQQAEFKDSIGAICKIIDLDADKATLQFNLAGITLLFISHYNAVLEERESTKIRPNGSKNYLTIEREVYDPDTDRTDLVKSYIYQDLIPTGLLTQSFDPTVKDSQIWTKLWQEATWGVLRPREKQRLPFKAMVGGTDPPEIDRIWQLLRDRPDNIVPLSSTQMLGVQSTNNEGISSTDRGSNYFLLHFWSYVAQIYLPFQVDIKDNVEFHGYAIAIPDVCNLVAFCQHFPAILQQRSTKIRWKKPDGAIVRHPIEVGLFFLRSIHTYLCANTDDLDIGDLLFGVDVFHIFRKKHEPQILQIQRCPPNKEKIEEFTQLEHKIFDPIFRLQYWGNLIHDRPRITGFDKLLSDLPFAKTIGNKWFCRDFRTLFHSQYNPMEPEELEAEDSLESSELNESQSELNEQIESPKSKEISIEALILRLLKTYTRQRLKYFGIEWNKEWKEQKSEIRSQDANYQAYKQKRAQIVRDLHIDFRRYRHPDEFLTYFASKFTGVSQYLTKKEYLFLAEQIQSQPDRIKILCLLALPAV